VGLPRIPCRTLMGAVAIAALTAWGYTMWVRSAEFAARASEHNGRIVLCEYQLDEMCYFHGCPVRLTATREVWRVMIERRARYEGRIYRKYRRAAFFPCLAVSPDPAPPPVWRATFETRVPLGDQP
jgi:hypothetical protein